MVSHSMDSNTLLLSQLERLLVTIQQPHPRLFGVERTLSLLYVATTRVRRDLLTLYVPLMYRCSLRR